MKSMREGHFIVLEGVDGAGTTTQSRRLSETLLASGREAHVTAEPSRGPTGMLLREVLAGRIVVPGSSGPRAPSWSTLALLFAADRLDHLESEVLPQISRGITVICDRYYHSSVAYQSCTGGGSARDIEWIKQINSYARRPDLTMVLDVSPQVAFERRSDRASREIFDQPKLQHDLCEFYRGLERHFPDERIVHVNAEAPFDEVAREILARAEASGGNA